MPLFEYTYLDNAAVYHLVKSPDGHSTHFTLFPASESPRDSSMGMKGAFLFWGRGGVVCRVLEQMS